MHSKFEIIKHSGNLPFSIFLHESKRVYPMNWHKEIEILFVLKGSVRVKIRDVSYTVHQDNIILVNSYEMHEITPLVEEIVILVFQFDPYFYQKYYPGFTEIIFHLNSTMLNKDANTYNTIKENLVIMMWYRLNKENTYQIKLLKQSLALIELLLRNFKKTMVHDRNHNDRSQQRLISIIEKINKNYNKKLTLSQIAEQEYISIHYLSKFFKNRVGIGFNKYLNLFRLNKSMNDLLNSNKMIIEIALEHGFSSVKAYTKLFKETYNETPSSFRKKYLSEISPKKKMTSITHNSRAILHNYIQLHAKDFLSGNLNQVFNLSINMLNKESRTLKKEKIVHLNVLYDGLNAVTKQNLEEIATELPMDYLRITGILNPNMTYACADQRYNWFYVDNLLESLLQIGVKPFISLSYDEKSSSIKQWQLLLTSFINHCLKKYGLDKVSNWKFELHYGSSSINQIITLNNTILKKLAQQYQELTIGISIRLNEGIDVSDMKALNIPHLSFITLETASRYYWRNTEHFNELITWYHNRHMQIYLFESNTDGNELHDTCFMTGYFIYHYLHTYNNVTAILPFMDKMIGSKIFNGDNGLLTFNGLRKPLYTAYYLVNKIHGEIVSEGDYYIATRNLNKYYILLYYYDKHMNNIWTPDKSTLPHNQHSKQISNSISNIVYVNLKLMEGDYKVRTYVLNEENGCIFSEWMKMGAPQLMDHEDIKFLKSKEQMEIRVDTINTKDSLHLESSVKPNEVRLIEVTKL